MCGVAVAVGWRVGGAGLAVGVHGGGSDSGGMGLLEDKAGMAEGPEVPQEEAKVVTKTAASATRLSFMDISGMKKGEAA